MLDTSALRRDILLKRDSLSIDFINEASGKIAESLWAAAVFNRARLPFIYVSFRTEVFTHNLIRGRLDKGLPVAVPFTDVKNKRIVPVLIEDWERDLAPGSYGILEPYPSVIERHAVPSGTVDVVVAPGSVFDRHCGRYGYGGGYYDRFFEKEAPCAFRIGLCFQFQLLENIPLAPHDQLLDLLVTEREVIECGMR